jgi:hypothetical protein
MEASSISLYIPESGIDTHKEISRMKKEIAGDISTVVGCEIIP